MSFKPFVCPITNVIIPPLEEMQARIMQPLKPTNLSQISDKVASSKTEEEILAEKKRILMLKFCRTKYVKDNNAEDNEELDAPDITDSHLIGCDEFGKFIGSEWWKKDMQDAQTEDKPKGLWKRVLGLM
ncbi:hypothetical protein C8Q75DRAFT_869865 [Abortiporus biennis]|nr:hypothetical protein C8Q75DRAFT_869865 [Abortiporus biennis]